MISQRFKKVIKIFAIVLLFLGLLILVGHQALHILEYLILGIIASESTLAPGVILAHSLPGLIPTILGIILLEWSNHPERFRRK